MLVLVSVGFAVVSPASLASIEFCSQSDAIGPPGPHGVLQSGADVWPFDPSAPITSPPGTKLVYAHYMRGLGLHITHTNTVPVNQLPLNPETATDSLANIKCEVERAIELGLDGFGMVFQISDAAHYFPVLQAAKEVGDAKGKPFKIRIEPDYAIGAWTPGELTAHMMDFMSSPNNSVLLRVPASQNDGVVIAPFSPETKNPFYWSHFRTLMNTRLACPLGNCAWGQTRSVALLPQFLSGWYTHASDYKNLSVGYSDWGTAAYAWNLQRQEEACEAHNVQAYGEKLWMGSVRPQTVDPAPNALKYYEPVNSANFRQRWKDVINDGYVCQADASRESSSDWAQINTWNDYSEGTEIAPSTGTQFAFYDLAAYYIRYFKNGVKPPIVRNVLYYFHRKRHTSKSSIAIHAPGNNGHVPSNKIELVAFVKAPCVNCTLKISLNGTTLKEEPVNMNVMPNVIYADLTPEMTGAPLFQLLENGVPRPQGGQVQSLYPITQATHPTDVLYRGGSSTRNPIPSLYSQQ